MSNIIVTGANRGLGLEFVKQLAKFSKTEVLALCRHPDGATELKKVGDDLKNIHIIKADLGKFDKYNDVFHEIQQYVKRGGINLLINNAGVLIRDNLKSVKRESIIESLEINAVAPLLFTKALLPLMKNVSQTELPMKIKKSVVLNISSQLGSIEENNGEYLSYRLSKACLNMATKSMAVELKADDVFVMAIHPGWVKTDMGGKEAPLTADKSVQDMLSVLFNADDSHNGCFLNTKGLKILCVSHFCWSETEAFLSCCTEKSLNHQERSTFLTKGGSLPVRIELTTDSLHCWRGCEFDPHRERFAFRWESGSLLVSHIQNRYA